MKEPPADIHLPTALPHDFQEINQRFPIYLYMIITYKKFLWKKNRTHCHILCFQASRKASAFFAFSIAFSLSSLTSPLSFKRWGKRMVMSWAHWIARATCIFSDWE